MQHSSRLLRLGPLKALSGQQRRGFPRQQVIPVNRGDRVPVRALREYAGLHALCKGSSVDVAQISGWLGSSSSTPPLLLEARRDIATALLIYTHASILARSHRLLAGCLSLPPCPGRYLISRQSALIGPFARVHQPPHLGGSTSHPLSTQLQLSSTKHHHPDTPFPNLLVARHHGVGRGAVPKVLVSAVAAAGHLPLMGRRRPCLYIARH